MYPLKSISLLCQCFLTWLKERWLSAHGQTDGPADGCKSGRMGGLDRLMDEQTEARLDVVMN